MRRSIGERLRRTVDTAVSLTLTREVRVEALVAARANAWQRDAGSRCPYDAFIVKALAAALGAVSRLERDDRRHGPRRVLGDQHRSRRRRGGRSGCASRPQCRRADRDEDRRGDPRPERQSVSRYAARQADTAGGTATVTNLGGYGVDAFTPVLNPPQALVLGVGRIQQRPVVEDGALVVGTTCGAEPHVRSSRHRRRAGCAAAGFDRIVPVRRASARVQSRRTLENRWNQDESCGTPASRRLSSRGASVCTASR